MDNRFVGLLQIKHSDNDCTVGSTCIHANGWDMASMGVAKDMCPKGTFTPTFPHNSPGGTSYYFNFPMDMDAAKLMAAMDLSEALLRLKAGGGRHKWPEKI